MPLEYRPYSVGYGGRALVLAANENVYPMAVGGGLVRGIVEQGNTIAYRGRA